MGGQFWLLFVSIFVNRSISQQHFSSNVILLSYILWTARQGLHWSWVWDRITFMFCSLTQRICHEIHKGNLSQHGYLFSTLGMEHVGLEIMLVKAEVIAWRPRTRSMTQWWIIFYTECAEYLGVRIDVGLLFNESVTMTRRLPSHLERRCRGQIYSILESCNLPTWWKGVFGAVVPRFWVEGCWIFFGCWVHYSLFWVWIDSSIIGARAATIEAAEGPYRSETQSNWPMAVANWWEAASTSFQFPKIDRGK